MMKINTTKEKLLNVALPLMANFGVYGVSLRDIAKKANINVSSVLYHFGSKECFITTCGELCVVRLSSEIQAIAQGSYADSTELNQTIEESVEKYSDEISIVIMLLTISGTGFRDIYEKYIKDEFVKVCCFEDKFILNLRSFICLFIFKKVDLRVANEKFSDGGGVVELLCQKPLSVAAPAIDS